MAAPFTGVNPTKSGTGFLSFNSMPPRLHITAETDDFDDAILQHWREEGFDVTYLPFGNGGKAYVHALKHLHDDLELGEAFAIIAYGSAASICLDVCIKPMPHLCALICYYPDKIVPPNTKYPTQLQVLVHLAGSQGFSPSFEKCYRYSNTQPGFAESDLEEYNKVAERLSWSRSLGAVRRGFKTDKEQEMEGVWERNLASKYVTKSPGQTLQTLSKKPTLINVPTLTGGAGGPQLSRFYSEFFHPLPPSLTTRLISRTIGHTHIVDELVLSFRHTVEMPWILPGVPPTGKAVEIAMCNTASVRAGKIEREHVYWDQASVLVQVGLLDPKLVPQAMKKRGVTELPVVGTQGIRKVLDEDKGAAFNQMIPDW